MADGNTSPIVVWLADTAIVKKPLNGRQLYLIADAVTGNPIGKMNLEFFGYRQRWTATRKYDFDTANFAEFTDADGQAMLDAKRLSPEFNWVTIARNGEGRLAYMGFSNVWYPNYYDAEYNQTKVFTITDRPVYRPGQTVKFKFWIRHAKYDEPNTSDFAQSRISTWKSAIRRTTSRSASDSKAMPMAESKPSSSSLPTRRWACINCMCSILAAAASGLKNTRSPSSKSRSMPPASRSCWARRSKPRSRRDTTLARRSAKRK